MKRDQFNEILNMLHIIDPFIDPFLIKTNSKNMDPF